ncbi:hypothetical protein TL16_g10332 [Triparma laevis f. inornata]|uniref:Uncharacterized protein n=1 Tax=Triparma laevis f. inornata TaxID=1714386 RepID=A0A9W7EQB0_9STRA|nr:hypothetical protein TL16_g10332 [Triparma laevis f. inornata]
MDITPFSYALVDATDDYKDVEIDTTTFIRYMGSKESTSFKNEFKNETIILPTLKWNPEAVYPLEVYKSVGTWIRENSLRLQSVHVFSMLAKVAELEIKEGGDVWVSTSGKVRTVMRSERDEIGNEKFGVFSALIRSEVSELRLAPPLTSSLRSPLVTGEFGVC